MLKCDITVIAWMIFKLVIDTVTVMYIIARLSK
jgi:hypothetical protein